MQSQLGENGARKKVLLIKSSEIKTVLVRSLFSNVDERKPFILEIRASTKDIAKIICRVDALYLKPFTNPFW